MQNTRRSIILMLICILKYFHIFANTWQSLKLLNRSLLYDLYYMVSSPYTTANRDFYLCSHNNMWAEDKLSFRTRTFCNDILEIFLTTISHQSEAKLWSSSLTLPPLCMVPGWTLARHCVIDATLSERYLRFAHSMRKRVLGDLNTVNLGHRGIIRLWCNSTCSAKYKHTKFGIEDWNHGCSSCRLHYMGHMITRVFVHQYVCIRGSDHMGLWNLLKLLPIL